METPGQIRDRLLARFPGAEVTVIENTSPAAQHSLLFGAAQARELAQFLRDDPALQLDHCSNVTGVDWPAREIIDTVKTTVPDPAGGPPKVVEQKTKRLTPAYLEVVYHLYSIGRRHGPVIIRVRTGNRADQVAVPSLTPVWRACEFQEREVFDLFGVTFSGHPDLRRILMWDAFKDHPMRKDYVDPDDYEWEPTPHDKVLDRAKTHYSPAPQASVAAAVAPPAATKEGTAP